jgi:hypothetical protein
MRAFREAYVELINNSRPGHLNSSFLTAMVPGAGVTDQAWMRLRSEVATAAGAAGRSYARWGGTFTLRNAAYITHDVDPVANWEMSLRDVEQFPPPTVVAAVEAAIATAHQAAIEAQQRERGLTGLIAAFLRWPSNLREAVGPGGGGVQRTAAGVIGVVGQVIVAAVAGALATGLVATAVALWRAVF